MFNRDKFKDGDRWKLIHLDRVGDGANVMFCNNIKSHAKDVGDISDGYHSFNELYEFRKLYNALLFNEWSASGKYEVTKSKKHSDGSECFNGGWFIVTANTPFGQVSNHYELCDWDLFNCDEVEMSPKFDGHNAQDVAFRLKATALIK